MADLLLGDFSRRQLLPAEQQRVGHLSERVQVYQPHPPLQHTEYSATPFATAFFAAAFKIHQCAYLAVSVDIKHDCNREKNSGINNCIINHHRFPAFPPGQYLVFNNKYLLTRRGRGELKEVQGFTQAE